MSGELGTYSFLPWIRKGIANRIVSADLDPAIQNRAAITVNIQLEGSGGEAGDTVASIPREIPLYGPGDVVGIESTAILRTEPPASITNFEPNYLPYIEFYDEDFPWRYTPAAPAGNRLRPWLVLIVLEEDEFTEGTNLTGRPLPYIDIDGDPIDRVFPKAEQLWAWAHVHVNQNIAGENLSPIAADLENALEQMEDLLATNRDLAYSRLVCPRKLSPNTRYHAILTTTFESARLAGIGLDPADAPHATYSAWGADRPAPSQFPIYHRWSFRTGSRGDFEYLARLLTPKPADARVGRRDMDLQDPGSNLPGITTPALDGVLKLEGALLAPLSEQAEEQIEPWLTWDQPYPHAFQSALAQFVNLPDDYEIRSALQANQATNLDPSLQNDEDPLVTAPIYGRWHALTSRLLVDVDGTDMPNSRNWLHELNLDPRWRAGAGFGTDVIVANQEQYMDAIWDQVGDILEANSRIRLAQFSLRATRHWYLKQLVPMSLLGSNPVMRMTAPVHARIVNRGTTVAHQVYRSAMTPALTSPALRRILRPRSRLPRYAGFDDAINANNLLDRVNDGLVTASPPNTSPPDLPTVEGLGESIRPNDLPNWLGDLLTAQPWLRYLPLVLAFLIFFILLFAGLIGWVIGLFFVAAMVGVWRYLRNYLDRSSVADSIQAANQTPESVRDLPSSVDFDLTPEINLGQVTRLETNPPETATLGGSADNEEATRFKLALTDLYGLITNARELGQKAVPIPVDLIETSSALLANLNPSTTISRYVYGNISLPGKIIEEIGEGFVEAMAYAKLDFPMYRPLVDRSTELFVPNLNFVDQNSVTLLETNQRFIESYMVGINHEVNREQHFRGVPTDLRGTVFQQFWEPRKLIDSSLSLEQERQLKVDIKPIHEWLSSSQLGSHDAQEIGPTSEEEMVLVVRGELLKKYPGAIVYAQKAKWQPTSETDSTPDKSKERVFDLSVPILDPLYTASVKPDIYFIGFDLTIDAARGDLEADDEPGWYVCFKEQEGEPRLGLDVSRDGPLQVWNDMSWEDVLPGFSDGDLIDLSLAPNRTLPNVEPSGENQEKAVQWREDHLLSWTSNVSSAELAYILYQSPVLVGIHASEMLAN